MGIWKIIGGITLGVGAIAAAPFTGGGSLLGAATLAGSLAGAAGTAAAAGVVGGAVGAAISSEDKKESNKKNKNNTTSKQNSQEAYEKLGFNKLNLEKSEKEEFILILTSFGIAVANSDGFIAKEEKDEIFKFNIEINNSSLSQVTKDLINEIIIEKKDLESFKIIFNTFISQKKTNQVHEIILLLDRVLESIIIADGRIDKKELFFEEQWNIYTKQIKMKEVYKPNILIVGRTGVGKSSLVNLIIKNAHAKVGDGMPITKKFKSYGSLNNSEDKVVIYDSEGLELGKEKKIIGKINHFIKSKQKEIFERSKIHAIWHVIDSSNSRISDFDKKIKKELSKFNIPVAEIFTKVDQVNDDDLDSLIKEMYDYSSFNKAFYSSTSPFFVTNKEEYTVGEHNININKALSWTYSQIQ